MNYTDLIGETTAYDKKLMLERKEPLSWLKSVSAFANTNGGVLIFGVDDEDVLVGLADSKKDSEDLSEAIKCGMDPVPEFELELHELGGKRFMVVRIVAGNETPYYVHLKGHRDAFVRIGNESVKANASQLKRLVLKSEHRSFDSLEAGCRLADYSFETLRATYRDKTHRTFEDSDFESFGLTTDGGTLTNAGALFADNAPIRHSRVFCTRWNGLDKTSGVMEALDDKEFSGGLISLLNSTKAFIATNTKVMWRKTPDTRLEYPEYPERATTECVVNALIHRDYLELGSEVHVEIYDDRMEIYSPGGMPNGKRAQDYDLFTTPSKRRNPVIADMFQRLDLMERRGSGFRKIRDAYLYSPNFRTECMPRFSSDATDFYVVLPNLNYGVALEDFQPAATTKTITRTTTKTIIKEEVAITKDEWAVLQIIRGNPTVTAEEIGRKLGLSRAGAIYHINKLKSITMIRRVGTPRNGHWEVMGESRGEGE